MYYLFTQLLGIIGLVCSLVSFQQKDRKWIMIFQMAASLLFAFQLILLGGITGGCLDLISFVRTLIFSMNGKKKWASSSVWLVIFTVLMVWIGGLTWHDFYSILPIIGSVLSTFALWMRKEKQIRLLSLSVGPFWFVYNIVNGAITGAVNEFIAMVSILIGIYRCDRKSL